MKDKILIQIERRDKMKECKYSNYEELPLFLNAEIISDLFGIAISSTYELMHEKDFPMIRIGSRMVVPRDRFIKWIDKHFEEEV